MAIEDIPKFLVELGKTVEAAGMTYDKWIENSHEKLLSLVEKYTA